MKPTVGNDVEFILIRKNRPVSAIGLVGGSKHFPSPCLCGALQEDNVLAEINIVPASDPRAWERHIVTVIRALSKRLPSDIRYSTYASAVFSPKELSDPRALEFGCEPDINAWTHKENVFRPLKGPLARLRSAGGHVHVGIPGLSEEEGFGLIRSMDALIGLQAVILDKDSRRKLLYGKAGAMRFKPYGVEWRTPSNFWVHTPMGRRWMFDAAMFVAENYKSLEKYYLLHDITTIINTNDKRKARRLLQVLQKQINFPMHSSIKR